MSWTRQEPSAIVTGGKGSGAEPRGSLETQRQTWVPSENGRIAEQRRGHGTQSDPPGKGGRMVLGIGTSPGQPRHRMVLDGWPGCCIQAGDDAMSRWSMRELGRT
jgi:hypothetical protein